MKTETLERTATAMEIELGESGTTSISKQSDYLEVEDNLSAAVNRPVLISDKLNTLNKPESISVPLKEIKYNNDYFKYLFSFTGEKSFSKPLYVVCGEILSNGSMKPSLLMSHLVEKHPIYKQKDVSLFQRLSNGPNVASYVFSTKKDNENVVEVIVQNMLAYC